MRVHEQWQYCTGVGADCGTGNLVWHGWQTAQDCSSDQICESDGSSGWCTTCEWGCSDGACNEGCVQGANVAPSASPSSSGGGSGDYGPAVMNDGQLESSCGFCWIETGTFLGGGAYLRYDWSAAQMIHSIWIDTENASSNNCLFAAERTLAGGDIQWWNGSSWVTDGTVTGRTDDWSYTFSAPVTTTALRIYRAHSSPSENAVVFEWEVYPCN